MGKKENDFNQLRKEINATEKHMVYHHNMFGPSCGVASGNNEKDYEIYCHKERKICNPTKCGKCDFFEHSEMGYGVCCAWEETYEANNGDERVIQNDEAYFEFMRVENPDMYREMMKMIEEGDLDLPHAWFGLD